MICRHTFFFIFLNSLGLWNTELMLMALQLINDNNVFSVITFYCFYLILNNLHLSAFFIYIFYIYC